MNRQSYGIGRFGGLEGKKFHCEYCKKLLNKGRFCNKSCAGKFNTLVKGNYKKKVNEE